MLKNCLEALRLHCNHSNHLALLLHKKNKECLGLNELECVFIFFRLFCLIDKKKSFQGTVLKGFSVKWYRMSKQDKTTVFFCLILILRVIKLAIKIVSYVFLLIYLFWGINMTLLELKSCGSGQKVLGDVWYHWGPVQQPV